MRKDRAIAEKLRRSGKSYKFITKKLGVPISTLSGWFQKEPWSMEIRDKLAFSESLAYPDKLKKLQAALKKKYDVLHTTYRDEALEEFPTLKTNPLFIAGIMLYWGEGDKMVKNSVIRLSNSEPNLIKVFNLFLTEIMLIPKEKIKLHLILYPDLADEPMKRIWSASLGIPLDQFIQSTYIKGKPTKKRLSYGVGITYVCSRKYKEKLIEWIKLCEQDLANSTLQKQQKKI